MGYYVLDDLAIEAGVALPDEENRVLYVIQVSDLADQFDQEIEDAEEDGDQRRWEQLEPNERECYIISAQKFLDTSIGASMYSWVDAIRDSVGAVRAQAQKLRVKGG